MSCSPCTSDDVVTGLAQLSDQLSNLSAFLMFATVIVVVALVLLVVIAFVNGIS